MHLLYNKESVQQPIILSIDDTMIEKFGQKFENYTKLFNHAAHNGSNYLNGHCFVSLLLSVPVQEATNRRYLSITVGYRMWTKEKSKLAMAAELVRTVMEIIGYEHKVILCCDSWYPKGEVSELVNEFDNLAIISNVRSDTVLCELPPEPTGRRGRPRKYGERLSLEDFILQDIPNTDFYAGDYFGLFFNDIITLSRCVIFILKTIQLSASTLFAGQFDSATGIFCYFRRPP